MPLGDKTKQTHHHKERSWNVTECTAVTFLATLFNKQEILKNKEGFTPG